MIDRVQNAIQRIRKQRIIGSDLAASKSIDIDRVETVCLALGPYRNLTTLTAATLFLHPNCQVLNHASDRVFGISEIDFLSDFSKRKLDRFVQFAIWISVKGKRGNYGGSITHSHAFSSGHVMQELYESTNSGVLKKEVKSLFWKESLKTSNLIREKGIDLNSIFDSDERLRFLLPIRNPMDCAISNLKMGHVNLFRSLRKKPGKIEVVQAILDEIHWFAALQKKNPGRFFCYFEHEISRQMLLRLAEFLKLDADETWITNALTAMKIKSGYEHDRELLNYYRKAVTDNFTRFPHLSKGLLQFSGNFADANSDH